MAGLKTIIHRKPKGTNTQGTVWCMGIRQLGLAELLRDGVVCNNLFPPPIHPRAGVLLVVPQARVPPDVLVRWTATGPARSFATGGSASINVKCHGGCGMRCVCQPNRWPALSRGDFG